MSSAGNPPAWSFADRYFAITGTWPRPSTVWNAMTVWKMSRASARTASGVMAGRSAANTGEAASMAAAIIADLETLERFIIISSRCPDEPARQPPRCALAVHDAGAGRPPADAPSRREPAHRW